MNFGFCGERGIQIDERVFYIYDGTEWKEYYKLGILKETILDANTLLHLNLIPSLPISKITGLQTFINNINSLLSSDDVSLDELQEVVNFIKANREDLANLSINNLSSINKK